MLLIMLSSLILSTYKCTDANVVIQRPDTAYDECGRSLTLTCKLHKNAFAVSWQTGNEGITIAKCQENNCSKNPNYFGQYNFTFDLKLGVFNLTIVKVTANDNGRVLVCSDGSNFATRVIQFRGFEPMLFEDIETGNVMATSGCFFFGTQVSFKWIKISAISGTEEEFIPTVHRNYTSMCSNESGCWMDEQIQYNVMIQASQSDNGQYYLKMIAVYGNEQKESSNTTYKYIIDGRGDDENFKDKPKNAVIAKIVRVCLSLILLAVILISVCLIALKCSSAQKCSIICDCCTCCKAKFADCLQYIISKYFKSTSKGDEKLDDQQHQKIELVEKSLHLANSSQVDDKPSLRNYILIQSSSEKNGY